VYAQTAYELLLRDYRLAFDEYVIARNEYIEARSEYLKFQTLVSKSEVISKTHAFLDKRQRVLLTYLKMMKERLEQSSELTEDELKEFLLYINDEVDFLEEQLPLFNATNNLEDLVKISKLTETRYNLFVLNAYKMKALVVASKTRAARKTVDELVKLTGEQVARIRKEELLNTVDIDRWLVEAPERLQFAKENEQEGLDLFVKANLQNALKVGDSTYANFLKEIMVVIQYLREANGLLLQIVREIRFR
jgi:diadenosine tetraphosphate (Ap4A) HIT family hydrolase